MALTKVTAAVLNNDAVSYDKLGIQLLNNGKLKDIFIYSCSTININNIIIK